MNTSKIAFEIINDIYTLNNKYEKAIEKFENKKINETKFAKVQYILACKLTYLESIIEKLKESNYKFSKYEKELAILIDLQERINKTFNPEDLDDLSLAETFNLVTYLTKYEKIVNLNEPEELKDKVEHN